MTNWDSGGETPKAAAMPGKRDRLVAAAQDLMHRQGAGSTTLADIAAAAGVPLGNVYYYFRTKEDVVAAVVRAHADQLAAGVAALDRRHRTPRTRLKALVRGLAARRDLIASYGCPYGTLSAELSKRAGGSDLIAVPLMRIPLAWAENQFRALGRADARDLALELVAAYQGAATLSSALGEPAVMTRLTRRLERWIDTIAATDVR